MFQSQTGSLALSDLREAEATAAARWVSIPDGKPRPFRLSRSRRSMTTCSGFNPRREASPFQTHHLVAQVRQEARFQSQTGSLALSDPAS